MFPSLPFPSLPFPSLPFLFWPFLFRPFLQLLTWEVPWSGVDFWEIVAALLGGERLPVPAREALPGADTPGFAGLDAYCQLMQRCQSGEPADRPTFLEIIPQLRCVH